MSDDPVRKIKNNTSKKNIGYFPSKKNQKSIAYESLLEKDYMYLLEYDKDVLSFTEQPLTIEYNCFDKRRTYTPDLKVSRNNKTQIIEVKPYTKLIEILNDDKKKEKFIAAYHYCSQNNFEFKIVTDRDIHNGLILKNIKYLFRYSNIEVPSSEKLKIKNELSFGALDIETLLSKFSKEDYFKFKSFIFSLIYSRTLKINLEESISDKSLIEL